MGSESFGSALAIVFSGLGILNFRFRLRFSPFPSPFMVHPWPPLAAAGSGLALGPLASAFSVQFKGRFVATSASSMEMPWVRGWTVHAGVVLVTVAQRWIVVIVVKGRTRTRGHASRMCSKMAAPLAPDEDRQMRPAQDPDPAEGSCNEQGYCRAEFKSLFFIRRPGP